MHRIGIEVVGEWGGEVREMWMETRGLLEGAPIPISY
jgi:hypothetical protein